jgi:hypothetical protein
MVGCDLGAVGGSEGLVGFWMRIAGCGLEMRQRGWMWGVFVCVGYVVV